MDKDYPHKPPVKCLLSLSFVVFRQVNHIVLVLMFMEMSMSGE